MPASVDELYDGPPHEGRDEDGAQDDNDQSYGAETRRAGEVIHNEDAASTRHLTPVGRPAEPTATVIPSKTYA